MGVPGADDIMLNYQSTSFHDARYVRAALGLRPAPEFEDWLKRIGLFDERLVPAELRPGNRMLEWVEAINDFKIKD
jgi:ethanolamine ammonia-lyase large subunit